MRVWLRSLLQTRLLYRRVNRNGNGRGELDVCMMAVGYNMIDCWVCLDS